MGRAVRALVAAALVWLIPGTALAHGIGGRQDLPVPVGFFVAGAGVVLMLSFAALAVLWPEPRMQAPAGGRVFGATWIRPVTALTGSIGVVALLLVVLAGLFGVDNATRNPGPVIVFVVFWLVIPFLSGIVGNVYPAFDPWRRMNRWIGVGRREGDRVVAIWGYWPGVVAFVAFTWLELVAPDAGPRSLAIAALVYTAYLVAAAEMTSRRSATIGFDGFALYNRLLGGIGPLERDGRSSLRWRGWLRGLPLIPDRPGLTAMVVAMIGTVTYDGASATPWWADSVGAGWQVVLVDGLGISRTVAGAIGGTVGLIGVTAIVGAAYLAASAIAARVGGPGPSTMEVARRFAHTLVPIGFAYAVAHYFTLVLFEGQLLLSTISDPFGRGWDLFGTAGRPIDFTLLSPTAVWYVQVAVIVVGHVAGVTLAHDRALADFPPETAVRSQYAMLGLMVALTGLGLVILAAG